MQWSWAFRGTFWIPAFAGMTGQAAGFISLYPPYSGALYCVSEGAQWGEAPFASGQIPNPKS